MSWVRLDDGWEDHPKFLNVVDELVDNAQLLWVRVLSYCNRHRTGGLIPPGIVRLKTPRKADADALVAELVRVGLWENAGDRGLRFHDYEQYQRGKASGSRSEAAKKAANARWAKVRAARSAPPADASDANAYAIDAPLPDPDPDPDPREPVPLQPPEKTSLQEPHGARETRARSKESDALDANALPSHANASAPPEPPKPPLATTDQLLTLLGELADEGHPWCSQLRDRMAQRGYRLTPNEQARLRQIRAERAAALSAPAPTGPPKRNGHRAQDLIPVADGGRSTLQTLQPGDYDWRKDEPPERYF